MTTEINNTTNVETETPAVQKMKFVEASGPNSTSYGSLGGYNYKSGYGYQNLFGYNYGKQQETQAPKMENSRLEQIIKDNAKVFMECVLTEEDAANLENPKPIVYFMTKSGIGKMVTKVINGNTFVFFDTAKEIPFLPELTPSVGKNIVNKIPKELLQEVIGSFNRIYLKTKYEAAAQIYRKPDGEYFIYYPQQAISGAQVKYTDDPNLVTLRQEGNTLIMELHSHNSMGAFWSGTDNSNEKECGLYMVIGTFGSPTCTYKCRVKNEDIYVDFPAHEVFDMTEEEEKAMLLKENITEGNPVIESKIIQTTHTTYKDYRGHNNKSLFRDIKKGEIITNNYKTTQNQGRDRRLSTWRFRHSDKRNGVYFSVDGYKYDPANFNLGWQPVANMCVELANSFGDKYDKFGNAVTDPKLINEYNPQCSELVQYLSGNTLDDKTDPDSSIARPGQIIGSINLSTDINPEESVIVALDTASNAMVNCLLQLQKAVIPDSDDGSVPMTSETAFISADLFWEVLTDIERHKLARFFKVSLLEFNTIFKCVDEYAYTTCVNFCKILCVDEKHWPAMQEHVDAQIEQFGFTSIDEYLEILDFDGLKFTEVKN